MIRTQTWDVSAQTAAMRARSRGGSLARRMQKMQGATVARRVLGIDPGLHITGYGLIEIEGAPQSSVKVPKLVEAGILKAKPTDELAVRLQTLFDGLSEVLRQHTPDVVVIEDLFSTYAHPRSALQMAHARGVLILAAQQAGAHVHSFLPNEVKQVVARNGHASKVAMQNAVKARLNLAAPPNPPDVADALAIALCYAARQDIAERLR